MRLIVGCTLGEAEVAAILRGEALRAAVEARLAAMPLITEDAAEADALELLAWMIARGVLEVRLAVPCDAARRPVAGTAIFHAKSGIVEDKAGNRLAFSASINETPEGWTGHWEEFHVFTSWGADTVHLDAAEQSFARLWEDRARAAIVLPVPAAVAADLMRFLPPEGELPRRLSVYPEPEPTLVAEAAEEPAPPLLPPAEAFRRVWAYIAAAPHLPGGERLGEATAAVTPWPHQVRAFERMWQRWPARLLVADEVGLGKTIEAGLLVRQAWLSGRAKRILIMAPKAVLRQWQIELREKFNLNWPIYDGGKLSWYPSPAQMPTERPVARDAWHREPFLLASSHLLRRRGRAAELSEQAEPFDLVVLDEAHHARRRGAGNGGEDRPNRLLALMRRLREKTRSLVLLTATPMQVHPVEVWDLLDLLGLPPGWHAQAFLDFFQMAALPAPGHEQLARMAVLFRTVEAWDGEMPEAQAQAAARRMGVELGGLALRKVLRALRDPAETPRRMLSAVERKAAVAIMLANTPVARRVSRNTRELLRAYHRAGRLGQRIAERDVHDLFVELSAPEAEVYAAVERYISEAWQKAAAEERSAVGFVMTIYRRRLASSFAALRSTLEGRLAAVKGAPAPPLLALGEDLEDEGEEEPLDTEDAAELERQALAAEEGDAIRDLLAAVRALPLDGKAQRLLRAIAELREQGYPQVMVFTQYTDTMDFLRDLVAERLKLGTICFSGRGGEVRERDGSWRPITRERTKELFREGGAQVMLCTDAAAEGLNFQFCGALVNYDLPWNPMRVEQRIGRIDRLGQEHARIRIVNLHYADTVEADIYRALRDRIRLFQQYVGKLQPILARLPQAIGAAVLSRPADRDRTRAEVVGRLAEDVREAEAASFDLDQLAGGGIEAATRRPAPYDLADLERVLARPELRPRDVLTARAGNADWTWLAPGMAGPARVTTSAAFFDAHPESCELWSPGSPLFPETMPESLDAPPGRAEFAALIGAGLANRQC
jgi:ERCC4-related helicase